MNPRRRNIVASLGLAASMLPIGCGDLVIDPLGGGPDSEPEPEPEPEPEERLTASDKVDLLLVLDNSRLMADKQKILEQAVPHLLEQLTNPPCVDGRGVASGQRPAGPFDPCPSGTSRRRLPVSDLHIGVITTSLGGHGSDNCSASVDPTENDQAHLITRSAGGGVVEGWNGTEFLVWDPNAQSPSHNPPGESDPEVLSDKLTSLVMGAGEVGCGFEATHEAWYRFLVDPDPHASIVIDGNGQAVAVGTDQKLLQQRAAFLRPDSLVAVVVLSDEDDCSIRDGGMAYLAAQSFYAGQPYHLPRPRAACATDPNDPCCRSCAEPPGPGCDDSQDQCSEPSALKAIEDHINVRCFDQKRRFGKDFLYPIDRYTTGLTEIEITDRTGAIAENPLFVDPDGEGGALRRGKELVFLSAIVGVPWQDLARRDANGKPDLLQGLDAQGAAVGGFQTAAEIADNGVWGLVLGDPEQGVPPQDPFMAASIDPRTGTNPVSGVAITPPGDPNGNPINGSERTLPQRGNLQLACRIQLPTPRDCSVPSSICDCSEGDENNPLCNPENPTEQLFAGAVPGLRHMQLLESLGSQAIPASVCAITDVGPTSPEYGYRAAMAALLESITPALPSE